MITTNASGLALSSTAIAAFTGPAPVYRFDVEIQFTGSGSFTSISAYINGVNGNVSQTNGITGGPGANKATLELDNGSGNFSPTNFSSPYNGADQGDGLGGNLRRGRKCRIKLAVDKAPPAGGEWESVYLFTGYTESYKPSERFGERQCTVTLYDELMNIAAAPCKNTILESFTITSACTYILGSMVGLDSSSYNVGTSSMVIGFIQTDSTMNCLNALNEIIASRLGQIWCDESGVVQVAFELDNGQDGTTRYTFSGTAIDNINTEITSHGDYKRLIKSATLTTQPLICDAAPVLIYKDLQHTYDAVSKTLGWVFAAGEQLPATACTTEYYGLFNAYVLLDTTQLSYLIESNPVGQVIMISADTGCTIASAAWASAMCDNQRGRAILKNLNSATTIVTNLEMWGRKLWNSSGFESHGEEVSLPFGDTVSIQNNFVTSMNDAKKVTGFIKHRYSVQKRYGSVDTKHFGIPYLQNADKIILNDSNVTGSTVAAVIRGKVFRFSNNAFGQTFNYDEADTATFVYDSAAAFYSTSITGDNPYPISHLILISATALGCGCVTSGAVGSGQIAYDKTDGSSIINYTHVPENLIYNGAFEMSKGTGCALIGAVGLDFTKDFAAGWSVDPSTSSGGSVTICYGSGLMLDQYYMSIYSNNKSVSIRADRITNIMEGSAYSFRCYSKATLGVPQSYITLSFFGASGTTVATWYWQNATQVFDSGALVKWSVTPASWASGALTTILYPPTGAAYATMRVGNDTRPTVGSTIAAFTQFQLVKGAFSANTFPPYTTGRMPGQEIARRMLFDQDGLRFMEGDLYMGLTPALGGLVMQNWGSSVNGSRMDYQYNMIYNWNAGYNMVAFNGVVPGSAATMVSTFPNFLDCAGSAPATGARVMFFDASRSADDFIKLIGQDGSLMLNSSGLQYTGLQTNLKNALTDCSIKNPGGMCVASSAGVSYLYVMGYTTGHLYRINIDSKQIERLASSICAANCGNAITTDGTYLYITNTGTNILKLTMNGTSVSTFSISTAVGLTAIPWLSSGDEPLLYYTNAAGNEIYYAQLNATGCTVWNTSLIMGTATACPVAYRCSTTPLMKGIFKPDVTTTYLYIADYNNNIIHKIVNTLGIWSWVKAFVSPCDSPLDIDVQANGSDEVQLIAVGENTTAQGTYSIKGLLL